MGKIDKVEKRLRDEFAILAAEYAKIATKDDAIKSFKKSNEVWEWIQNNFIPRSDIEKAAAQLHGGGNARRLFNQLLKK